MKPAVLVQIPLAMSDTSSASFCTSAGTFRRVDLYATIDRRGPSPIPPRTGAYLEQTIQFLMPYFLGPALDIDAARNEIIETRASYGTRARYAKRGVDHRLRHVCPRRPGG